MFLLIFAWTGKSFGDVGLVGDFDGDVDGGFDKGPVARKSPAPCGV
jgi:hypothetical protein